VLLTGGLRYLGGRLAQTLAAATNCEMRLGKRRTGLTQLPAPVAKFVRTDGTREFELQGACEDMDAVMQLACMNAADYRGKRMAALAFSGVGTARLVRTAAVRSVTRFLYLSIAHACGAGLSGALDELTFRESRHSYAISLRAGGDDVLMTHDAGAIEGIIMRPLIPWTRRRIRMWTDSRW
jgi:UDP-glucose 4-epimerase